MSDAGERRTIMYTLQGNDKTNLFESNLKLA